MILINVAIFGLIIGSFLNVVVHRMPIMLLQDIPDFNLMKPASHCRFCHNTVRWWQNIPLLSFIFLKGRCAFCHKKINWRYPLIELLTAVVFLIIVAQLGLSWQSLAGLILASALICLIFIDFEHQLLPDEITLPILWVGLLTNVFNLFVSPADAIIGAAVGYSLLWVVAKLFKWIRGIEGMGYGDFKLLALLGAWFGWQGLLFIVLVASLLGSIVGVGLIFIKKKQFSDKIAFGPYLAFAGWLLLVFYNSYPLYR